MAVRDKNHQYQQKVTFWNLICRYVFAKRVEKVIKKRVLCVLCVFSKKYKLRSLRKRVSQSARNHPDAFILGVSKRSSHQFTVFWWPFSIEISGFWQSCVFIPIGMLIVFSYLFFTKNTKKHVFSSILTRFFSKFRQFHRKLIPVHLLKSFWHPNPKAFGKIPINFMITLESTSRAINQLDHKKS